MKLKLFCAAVAMTISAAAANAATYVYVGSWQVDDGSYWADEPMAYTGQEAAALLFGGSADDYAISTLGSSLVTIDNLSWVSTWGGACAGANPCGTKVAEDYKVSTGGFYLNPGDTSAYVTDWAIGSQYTNYAFKITDSQPGAVPEPATWAMLIAGFGLIGAAMRRRRISVSA